MPEYPMTEDFATDRGAVHLSRPAPGIVLTVVTGYASTDIAQRIIDYVSAAIEAGERPAVFHDWEGATGYEPRARPMFANWYMRVRRDVDSVHVLSRSKVVSMGVSLVSIATNNSIVSYRDRSGFELALAAAKRAQRSVAPRV